MLKLNSTMKPAEKALWIAIGRSDLALVKLHLQIFSEPGQLYSDENEFPSLDAINADDSSKSFFILALEKADATVVDHLAKKLPLSALLTYDANNRSPLSYAAAKGYSNIATQLLAANMSVHTIDKATGRTALSFAAEHGNQDVVTSLLAAGARLSQADGQGLRPLDYACKDGHTAVAALLLEAGALPLPYYIDKNGKTALDYAVDKGNAELLALLLSYGAAIGAKLPEMSVQLCEELKELINNSETTIFMLGTQGAEYFAENTSAVFCCDESTSIKYSSTKQVEAWQENCNYRLSQPHLHGAQQDIKELLTQVKNVAPIASVDYASIQAINQRIANIASYIAQLGSLKAYILAHKDNWWWRERDVSCSVPCSISLPLTSATLLWFGFLAWGLTELGIQNCTDNDGGIYGAVKNTNTTPPTTTPPPTTTICPPLPHSSIFVPGQIIFVIVALAFLLLCIGTRKVKPFVHRIDKVAENSRDELVKLLQLIAAATLDIQEVQQALQPNIATLTGPMKGRHVEVLDTIQKVTDFFFSEQQRIQDDPEKQSGYRYVNAVTFYPPPKPSVRVSEARDVRKVGFELTEIVPKEKIRVAAKGGNEHTPLLQVITRY